MLVPYILPLWYFHSKFHLLFSGRWSHFILKEWINIKIFDTSSLRISFIAAKEIIFICLFLLLWGCAAQAFIQSSSKQVPIQFKPLLGSFSRQSGRLFKYLRLRWVIKVSAACQQRFQTIRGILWRRNINHPWWGPELIGYLSSKVFSERLQVIGLFRTLCLAQSWLPAFFEPGKKWALFWIGHGGFRLLEEGRKCK